MSESLKKPKKSGDLQAQVAVVTGGARGLGSAILKSLANRGAKVVSLDLTVSDETIEQVVSAGGEASGFVADLTDEKQVNSAFAKTFNQYGQIDILVNNAGFYQVERRPFWEIGLVEWQQVVNANILPTFLCSKAASESMRKAGRGRIINISSDCISFGMPNLMHYVAAKTAVVGMTRSMARELGCYGINVNAIAPGLIANESAKESIGLDAIQKIVG